MDLSGYDSPQGLSDQGRGDTLDLAQPDLSFAYSWQTGSWSSCSAACGGGTQSRDVYCERSDGVTVSDTLCSGSEPVASQSCNTQACCRTEALQAGMRCDGDAQVQWMHFGSDTGSAGDQASCASTCTTYAQGQLTQWCCQLYEDSSSGTNWVCRVYDQYAMHASTGPRFSGLGRCQSP